ncbi:MAG: ferrochelatase [Gammaproteobacteria bacterium]
MNLTPLSGIVLINLGTPEAPAPEAIRPWLREFLSDRRVVDLPRWLWWPLLHGVILPLRPRKLAPLYARIWRPDGSPLLAIAREQRAALAAALAADGAPPVVEGMRYGKPSVADALARLREAGVGRLVVLPLYPQYSGTTTGSALDAVQAALAAMAWRPPFAVVEDYHADAGYVAALAGSVREHWAAHGRGDVLLMSFHGIPQRYATRGDPYGRQCQETARRLAAALQLKGGEWQLAYQSRVGNAAWLGPYTDVVVPLLARRGVRRLDVVCPGFAADCLETLDEIAIRYAGEFVASGGEGLRYVPALNARPAHVETLARLVRAHLTP